MLKIFCRVAARWAATAPPSGCRGRGCRELLVLLEYSTEGIMMTCTAPFHTTPLHTVPHLFRTAHSLLHHTTLHFVAQHIYHITQLSTTTHATTLNHTRNHQHNAPHYTAPHTTYSTTPHHIMARRFQLNLCLRDHNIKTFLSTVTVVFFVR